MTNERYNKLLEEVSMDLFHAVIDKYLPPPSRMKDLLDLCVNEAKYFVDKIDELSIKVKQNE